MSCYHSIQITKNPAIFSGRPVINGHRITVHAIVVHYQAGMSVEDLSEEYGLTSEEVMAALAYYEGHTQVIDRQIEADRREIARRAAADTSPVAERMRELGRTLKHRQVR